MKNVKYLGFVGLGCAALLLTGCGGSSHTLTCTKSEEGQTQELVYEFDDKEEKVTGAKMNMTVKIPEGTSDEDLEKEKESLEQLLCGSGMLEGCKTDISGGELKFEASVSKTGLESDSFSGGSLEEVKDKYTKDGYTCK